MEHEKRAYLAALLTAGAAGFVLGGYECVRSAANTVFKAEFGAAPLAYVGAALPFVIIAMIYLYGKSINHLGVRRTVYLVYLGSAVLMLGAYAMIESGAGWAAAPLVLFRKIYVVVLIEQYWSYINSVLTTNQGKRMNGLVCGIASLGAIVAGYFVGHYATTIGTNAMILIAGISVFPAAGLSWAAFRVGGVPQSTKVSDSALAFGEFRKEPIAMTLLILILATQVLSAAYEMNFQFALLEAFPDQDAQTSYSGTFFANLNLAAALLQFVGAPICLRYLPQSLIHGSLPVIHISASLVMLVSPSLASIATALFIFKALDYSLFRATKELLYIPLSFDIRYKAKQVIDVLGYRGGESLASVIMIMGKPLLGNTFFASLGILACAGWMVCLRPILRRGDP